MIRVLLSAGVIVGVIGGCTVRSSRAAPTSDTANTDTDTAQKQQGVGTPENPPSSTDSGKRKPKASDVSTPTAD